MAEAAGMTPDGPAIAIVPWGDVIEDFLDPIGVPLETFIGEMTGGWLFGYVKALTVTGFRPVIIVISRSAETPRTECHKPTGARVVVLPQASHHKWLRRFVGDRAGRAWVGGGARRSLTSLVQYLGVPAFGLRNALTQEDCRAVILQEYEYARSDRIARLAGGMGLPVLATFQGANATLSPVERRMRRHTLRMMSGLIVPSAQERRRLQDCYDAGPSRIHAIPNPLDAELWFPEGRARARQELGLDPTCPIAICHGRIAVHAKGLDILLAAWAETLRTRTGDKPLLVIVGSGEDDEVFARLVADCDPATMLWQRKYETNRAAMRRWLSAADFYVSASRIEGMPVAPLEAMACGLPVIATDAPGLDDIFGTQAQAWGMQIPTGSMPSLRDALTAMLDLSAEERARRGEAARAHVLATFSVDKVAADFNALLGSLCAARKAGA